MPKGSREGADSPQSDEPSSFDSYVFVNEFNCLGRGMLDCQFLQLS